MPLIEIKVFEDEFGDEQRTGIIEAVTDTMVSLTEESIRPHSWVVLEGSRAAVGGSAAARLASRTCASYRAQHPPTPRLHRAPAEGPDDGDLSDERRLSTTPATSPTFEQTNGFIRALQIVDDARRR